MVRRLCLYLMYILEELVLVVNVASMGGENL